MEFKIQDLTNEQINLLNKLIRLKKMKQRLIKLKISEKNII